MHPSSEIDREYAVRILGEVSEDNLALLKKGVQLEDGLAKFDEKRARTPRWVIRFTTKLQVKKKLIETSNRQTHFWKRTIQ
jgi:16S rRNA U516 pseudouridylate synthase RsuA-like enzyme